MLSVPDAEKFPEVMGAFPRTIVFEWVWPSETARQANSIDSTDVGVAVKEVGKPWLVVPTNSRVFAGGGRRLRRLVDATGSSD